MSDAHEHYASSFYGLDFDVPDFRAQVAGVASSIRSESGFPAFVLEFAYLKYLHNQGVRVHHQYHKFTRFNLWVSACYLKHYPRQGRFWTLAPLHMPMRDTRVRRLIAATLSLLNAHMQEISELHFDHPNNHVSHFPRCVVGGVDTFPVLCKATRHRCQPKYKDMSLSFRHMFRTWVCSGS